MSKKLLFAVLALALATMACGFQVNLPQTKTPGPDITTDISVDAPTDEADLKLSFGAGELSVMPGGKDKLVSGSATYNIADFEPQVIQTGSEVEIRQGNYQVNGFPTMQGLKNEWVLKLGDAPMSLTVNAGAYKGAFDLGGLSLTNLNINDGAAEVTVDFSAPNKVKMNVLKYQTGASNVNLLNLSNANFTSLVFEGGAGNYKLDFGGKLERDASVNIRAGMSNVTLVIPEGLAVQVTSDSGLSNLSTPAGWSKNGDVYRQDGDGPTLSIVLEVGAGNVQIVR
jgi:hypothetical protein